MPNVKEDPGSEMLGGFTRARCWFRRCCFPAVEEAMQGHSHQGGGGHCWMTSQHPRLAEDQATSG